MQIVQIEHEKSLAVQERIEEIKANKRSLLGSVIEKVVDIGQKFIGV